jgi:hypothetical protein
MYLTELLTLADDFAAAERVCADGPRPGMRATW